MNVLTINYKSVSDIERLICQALVCLSGYRVDFYFLNNSDFYEFDSIINCLEENGCIKAATTQGDERHYSFSKLNFFIFQSSENIGFAGGMNFLLEKSSGDHDFIFLNPDVELTDSALKCLISSDFPYDINGFVIHNEKKVEFAHGVLPLDLFYTNTKIRTSVSAKKHWPSDWVTFALVVVRKSVINTMKASRRLFNSDLFLYCEDIDFCIGARNLGFSIGVSNSPFVFHRRSGSSGGGEYNPLVLYYINRNRFLLIKKNYNFIFTGLLFALKSLISFRYISRPKLFLIYCKAIWSGVLGVTGRAKI